MSIPVPAVPGGRLVATVGNVSDPRTYSGIPFHLLRAGRGAGLLDDGLDLDIDRIGIRARRLAWNLGMVMRGRGRGGFQYSEVFLEQMWRNHTDRVAGAVVLNCFQLYPGSLVADDSVEKWFFIDQPLSALFTYYEQGAIVGDALKRDALAREAEGYRAATGVITFSNWARELLMREHSLPPDKVNVVLLGPSLDPVKLEHHARRPSTPVRGEALRLIFVGKDWRQKGLDRLLNAVHLAGRRGAKLHLQVIGCDRSALPESLGGTENVEWLGFVDKRLEEDRFIEILSSAHLGCSLSRYEAGGIALREFHVLGLPVIGPDTGGAPEHMIPEASIAIAPEANPEQIADVLVDLWKVPERLQAMNEEAWNRRHSVTWASSMGSMASFWPHTAAR